MGGAWVAAGIIDSQAAEVEAALRAAGLHVTEHQQVADWVALIGKRV
jgi:ribosomal protein L11 methylase PrmA